MVMQLILEQENLIEEHDLFPSLQPLHVNTFFCLKHLQMNRLKCNTGGCKAVQQLKITLIYIFILRLLNETDTVMLTSTSTRSKEHVYPDNLEFQ